MVSTKKWAVPHKQFLQTAVGQQCFGFWTVDLSSFCAENVETSTPPHPPSPPSTPAAKGPVPHEEEQSVQVVHSSESQTSQFLSISVCSLLFQYQISYCKMTPPPFPGQGSENKKCPSELVLSTDNSRDKVSRTTCIHQRNASTLAARVTRSRAITCNHIHKSLKYAWLKWLKWVKWVKLPNDCQ